MGKSSLIKHVFGQAAVREHYHTLFVDIFGTKNAADFQQELQTALFAAPFAKGTKLRKTFEALVHSAYLDLGEVDMVTGKYQLPKVGLAPSSIPRIPLQEIFAFLENTDKPTLVVFDEFQQIEQYPERMAATLRSYIQQMNRTRFIFSGSSRHMLTTMFQLSNQPFYKSAVQMDLGPLNAGVYADYCQRLFREQSNDIDTGAILFVYQLFSGETYLMQETMKEIFAQSEEGASLGMHDAVDAIKTLIRRKDSDYREILNRLDNKKERNTLFCIAAEGVATGLTSSSIMRRYDLDNASSVQNALENLGESKHNLIDRIAKGTYVIQDRLFELWIADKGGYLDYKFEHAEERYHTQQEVTERLPKITPPKTE